MSKRTIGRWLESRVVLGLLPLIQRLSPEGRVRWGARLGSLLFLIDRRHRRLAASNMARALDLEPTVAEDLARRSFQHFGRAALEALALPQCDRELEREQLTIEGWEHLLAAHALGRGVIVYSAHFGNWEVVAQAQARRGIAMDFVARPLDNPWLDRMLTEWRERSGNRVLGKHGALRKALLTLKQGRGLAILIDQSVRVPPRLFVPFFERLASTSPTLGMLAVRTAVPVVPVVSFPRSDGSYLIRYEPQLSIPSEGTIEQRAENVTLAATRILERWIRERPECWLWMHDRWKWSPQGGERVLS